MNKKEQNPVKAIFSNIVKIGKAFEEIWLFKDFREMVEKAVVDHRYFLVQANGEKWVRALENKLKEGKPVKDILAFLTKNYREWQKKFLVQCDQFNTQNLLEPQSFNKAANALLNNFDLFDEGLDRKKALINKIKMVLALYPDCGYDPEADLEGYEDKLYNGALTLCGEEIIDLRSAQVIAEENFKLAK